MIFISSEVVVEQDSSVNAINVLVEKADGEKCERCWIYSTTVGTHHEHSTICSRCATVLESVDINENAEN